MSQDSILEGKISRADLVHHYAWFEKRMGEYKPDKGTVRQLNPYVADLSFLIVLGTWCSDSREHVPHFFRLAKSLDLPEDKIEIIGVDRKKHCSLIDITALNIQFVPTFIVFYKGKEIGRIVEDTHESLEKDILLMLSKY